MKKTETIIWFSFLYFLSNSIFIVVLSGPAWLQRHYGLRSDKRRRAISTGRWSRSCLFELCISIYYLTGLCILDSFTSYLYFFKCILLQDNVDSLVEAFNVNKATLLRSFCQKTGVQILLREYQVYTTHWCEISFKKIFFSPSLTTNRFRVSLRMTLSTCIPSSSISTPGKW